MKHTKENQLGCNTPHKFHVGRNWMSNLRKVPNLPKVLTLFLCILTLTAPTLWAQGTFDSGSTGADGPLIFYAPPSARYLHAMVYDSNRNVTVLFGGDAGPRLNDTWEYDGTAWAQQTPTNFPSARSNHAMAYDSSRNVVVLFGGFDGTRQNDTWEYNGANWTQQNTASSPSPRDRHAMVYDSSRNVVVLFGGFDGTRQNDTWEYDGTDWTQQNTGNSPSIRHGHAMVYDSSRNVVVLFGGDDGTFKNDTWEYDGTDWTEKTPTNSPSGRWNHAMAYDSTRNAIVLFGGQTPSLVGDTWEYDGVNWTQQNTANSPSGRYSHVMVYDSSRNVAVLFGGVDSPRHNDTWEYDSTWSAPNQIQPNPVFDMTPKPDGTWNYTTIDIPAGVTITFINNTSNTPVFWLATGEVNISGSIFLDGADASGNIDPGNEAQGDPGGFAGGLGGRRFDVSGSFAGTPGMGPGGGLPGTTSGQNGGNAGHASAGSGSLGGPAYGNLLLIPLIGGSGGAGGASVQNGHGANGGAGGGAILIASSGDITFNGLIRANGGNGGSGNSRGGSGSGGAIHLVANRVSGNGTLQAQGGSNGAGSASAGRIRVEGFFVQYNGSSSPLYSAGPPIETSLPSGDQGIIRITNVAGEVVPANPTGNPNSPDVVFSEAGQITVSLSTTNIPVGTVLTVRVAAVGQVLTVDSTPTDAVGNATATLTVPAGIGSIQAFTEFTSE